MVLTDEQWAVLEPLVEPEIAPELTGQGLPPNRCEAYDRPYDQPLRSD